MINIKVQFKTKIIEHYQDEYVTLYDIVKELN